MSNLDWIVLLSTLLFIVVYGAWKTRGSRNIEGYLLGDNRMRWGTIGLSVMATQASAITFLSTPGQAYESGMAFVQNYFGMPLALIVVSAVFIPIYYKLKVFTAYEYLEKRFDFKTRVLGALLFLIQRGLAAGITIYAPAIILSTMLGWNLNLTIVMVGVLVIIYTVSGGTKAVSLTQKYQMGVIMLGMFIAFYIVIAGLPEFVSFGEALQVAGKMGKLEAVDFSLDPAKRYTFWSGITGGLFLQLSYFGTDQSQVQRYLGGENIAQSRVGLMFNALLKVPMQFFILLVGVMVFVFYQFERPPVFFNQPALQSAMQTEYRDELQQLDQAYQAVFQEKQEHIKAMVNKMENGDEAGLETSKSEVLALDSRGKSLRQQFKEVLLLANPDAETKDADYVFITFIVTYLPHGVIGLLLAVIFSAAMSSTSSELNALASTTAVDFYKRIYRKQAPDQHYVWVSKGLTVIWGLIAISFAIFAYLMENLIEFVNIVGSLFYGTILGIFLVAFFLRSIRGTAVFYAAVLAQVVVLVLHFLTVYNVFQLGYLWYNAIGCLLVCLVGYLMQFAFDRKHHWF